MANNPQIKIGVGVDGAGISVAEGMFNAMFKRIGGKGAEVGKIFKDLMATGNAGSGLLGTATAFAAVAGAATLMYELGTHTAAWAHEIVEVSKQMNISTDAAQTLGFAASLMGKDLSWAAQMMEKINLVTEKALGGQADFVKLANAIGLTQSELKNLNIEDVFKKFLTAVSSGKLSDAQIENAVGVKNIRSVKSLAENQEYAEKYGIKVDSGTMAMMADEWKAWKTILLDLGVVLAYVGAVIVGVVRIIRKSIMWLNDIIIAAVATLIAGVLGLVSKIPRFGYLKKQSEAAWETAKEYGNAAGQNIEEIFTLAGESGQQTTNRKGDFGTGKGLEKLEGNPFLKVGGLMGIDTNFRMERLIQQIATGVVHIDDNTKPRGKSNEPSVPTQKPLMDYGHTPTSLPYTPMMA
jgi:hypothetical protein